METLAKIGEDALIRRLTASLKPGADVVTGPGDDCAVVRPLRGRRFQLLKTDCIVESVHFLRETAPGRVGWKAMARVVSDIAAMGGIPQHALVTLILPLDLEVSYVEQLYAGLRRCAEKFNVSIVGGEMSRGAQIVVSVSLVGSVAEKRCVPRDGAKAGDAIHVTGRLGGSLRGHHLEFMPRVEEAQWLAKHLPLHAMMDLSDGLAKDLPRMALASSVGFVLDESSLPVNEGCTPAQAWADGEDYELLFALPAPLTKRQQRRWQRVFPEVPLTCIGRFVEAGRGRAPSFSGEGWDHFNHQTRNSHVERGCIS
jgi:thiamine-monophosphate kinase